MRTLNVLLSKPVIILLAQPKSRKTKCKRTNTTSRDCCRCTREFYLYTAFGTQRVGTFLAMWNYYIECDNVETKLR